jgi:hypothetical protein
MELDAGRWRKDLSADLYGFVEGFANGFEVFAVASAAFFTAASFPASKLPWSPRPARSIQHYSPFLSKRFTRGADEPDPRGKSLWMPKDWGGGAEHSE